MIMANMLYPSPRFRSVTAATGLADAHDNHIYSAGLLQDGGSGLMPLFSQPKGGPMLALKGSSTVASTNPHQTTYTVLTTNLDRPSQMGDSLGDGAFRGIGLMIESARCAVTGSTAGTPNNGATSGYGATAWEMNEIASKCVGELKIGTKSQIQGPFIAFPNLGGIAGSVSNTGNASVVSQLQNGAMPSGRRFRTPLMVGRTDSLVFEFSVANGASLSFSNTGSSTNAGQPTLVWVVILADMASDVR
jgi:hypothetical protein